jgi:hypothetical protein
MPLLTQARWSRVERLLLDPPRSWLGVAASAKLVAVGVVLLIVLSGHRPWEPLGAALVGSGGVAVLRGVRSVRRRQGRGP